MFEEEAKEYSLKCCNGLVDSNDMGMLAVAYQDGAEFGYKQGIKEVLSKLSHHERMKVKALLKEVIK